MTQPTIIDPSLNIFTQGKSAKTFKDFDGKVYAIGLERTGSEDLILHLYEQDGLVWSEVGTTTLFRAVNLDAVGGPRPTKVSLHVLDNQLIVVFAARHLHETSVNKLRWYIQYAKISLSGPATFDFTTLSTDPYSMLTAEGPILFDSLVVEDKLWVAFSYGENEDPAVIEHSLAYVTTDGTTLDPTVAVYSQDEDIYDVFLDYDTINDVIYLGYSGHDNRMLYKISPNVQLLDRIFDLYEVRLVSRLYEHIGIAAFVGFRKGYPRHISIHNTYYYQVESDARNLSHVFFDNYLVLYYNTEDKVRYAVFDLAKRKFVRNFKILESTLSYSIPVEDGSDITENHGRVLFQLEDEGFRFLEFDLVIDAPEIIQPTRESIVTDARIQLIWRAPVENYGNNLDFNVKFTKAGTTYEFNSGDTDTEVTWEYNPSGDGITWLEIPDGGVPEAGYGQPVRATIPKEVVT